MNEFWRTSMHGFTVLILLYGGDGDRNLTQMFWGWYIKRLQWNEGFQLFFSNNVCHNNLYKNAKRIYLKYQKHAYTTISMLEIPMIHIRNLPSKMKLVQFSIISYKMYNKSIEKEDLIILIMNIYTQNTNTMHVQPSTGLKHQ